MLLPRGQRHPTPGSLSSRSWPPLRFPSMTAWAPQDTASRKQSSIELRSPYGASASLARSLVLSTRALHCGGVRTARPPLPSSLWGAAPGHFWRSEMLVDKIIIERHPSKIDKDGRRHYLIRAIPYQDPQQEAERLKAVHEARVKIGPRG
jgi:hypothetical protein